MLKTGGDTVHANSGTVTQLLHRWRGGDRAAVDELAALVYPELRLLARTRLAVCRDGELSPTELVHEAFLRLAQQRQPDWANRAHFFFIASRLMRQILVDLSRERQTLKRGEGKQPLRLDRAENTIPCRDESLLRLDDALTALALFDRRKAEVLEMRFFGGMTSEEIAAVLGIASATVVRDLRAAKAWLRAYLSGEEALP